MFDNSIALFQFSFHLSDFARHYFSMAFLNFLSAFSFLTTID